LRALSAHVVTDDIAISATAAIQHEMRELVSHKYGITHATLQLECEGCAPDTLYCDLNQQHRY
jgi:cobalt-zinc-cadmium efflux system protein